MFYSFELLFHFWYEITQIPYHFISGDVSVTMSLLTRTLCHVSETASNTMEMRDWFYLHNISLSPIQLKLCNTEIFIQYTSVPSVFPFSLHLCSHSIGFPLIHSLWIDINILLFSYSIFQYYNFTSQPKLGIQAHHIRILLQKYL